MGFLILITSLRAYFLFTPRLHIALHQPLLMCSNSYTILQVMQHATYSVIKRAPNILNSTFEEIYNTRHSNYRHDRSPSTLFSVKSLEAK